MFSKIGVNDFSNKSTSLPAKSSNWDINILKPLPLSADSFKYYLSFLEMLFPTPIVWSLSYDFLFYFISYLNYWKSVIYPSVNIPPSDSKIIYLGWPLICFKEKIYWRTLYSSFPHIFADICSINFKASCIFSVIAGLLSENINS